MNDDRYLYNTENELDDLKVETELQIPHEVGTFAFHNAPWPTIVYSAVDGGQDFRIEHLNRACGKTEDMDPDKDRGRTLKEVIPETESTDFIDVLRRVWLTGKSEHIPGCLYITPTYHVWRENFIHKLPSGNLLAFFKDVEKEKLDEIQYSAFMKSTIEGVFIFDEEGNHIDVNETACSMSGYSREELLGMNILDLSHNMDKEEAAKHFRDMKEKSEGVMRMPFVRKNGETRYWRVSASTLKPLNRYIVLTQDITELMKSRKALKQTNLELRNAFHNTLKTIAHVVEAKDMYSKGHHERVANLTMEICSGMDLDDQMKDKIFKAALVHDVGKIMIPSRILNMLPELSETEKELVRLHPSHSREILAGIGLDEEILDIVEQHHEQMDGNGYPHGLKGEQMHVGARILAVASRFDSLCLEKPYRMAFTEEEALVEMTNMGSDVFDPEVLKVFFELMENPARRTKDEDERKSHGA